MRTCLLLVVVLITGCSSYRPLCPGTRYYDPQVCRGESFQRLNNFKNEALQREAKCDANIQPEINCVWGRP